MAAKKERKKKLVVDKGQVCSRQVYDISELRNAKALQEAMEKMNPGKKFSLLYFL